MPIYEPKTYVPQFENKKFQEAANECGLVICEAEPKPTSHEIEFFVKVGIVENLINVIDITKVAEALTAEGVYEFPYAVIADVCKAIAMVSKNGN